MKKKITLVTALCIALCGLAGCSDGAAEAQTTTVAAENTTAAETEALSVENETLGTYDADTAIEEKIVGSWIVEDRKGQPALTNEKAIALRDKQNLYTSSGKK